VQVVTLTRKGEQTVEALFPLWQRAYSRLREALGAGALAELNDQLDAATAAVAATLAEKA